jgi:hypothetical protein
MFRNLNTREQLAEASGIANSSWEKKYVPRR